MHELELSQDPQLKTNESKKEFIYVFFSRGIQIYICGCVSERKHTTRCWFQMFFIFTALICGNDPV